MPSYTTKKIHTVRVYGKDCIGCIKNNSDVMISIQDAQDNEQCWFNDLFLTTQQANQLLLDLVSVLKNNKDNKENNPDGSKAIPGESWLETLQRLHLQ